MPPKHLDSVGGSHGNHDVSGRSRAFGADVLRRCPFGPCDRLLRPSSATQDTAKLGAVQVRSQVRGAALRANDPLRTFKRIVSRVGDGPGFKGEFPPGYSQSRLDPSPLNQRNKSMEVLHFETRSRFFPGANFRQVTRFDSLR